MGIYKIASELKLLAINTATVSMASFGDIHLYDNKATIRYPYCNFDIVNTRVVNNSIRYTFRIYVCDRNDPYIAYNKTNLILNSILKHYTLDATNYIANFFTLNFQDQVNGCWADFVVEEQLDYQCLTSGSGFTLNSNMGVYQIASELVTLAKGIETVSDSAFGDPHLYDNMATIKYPYVNVDVINSRIINNSNEFTFRIYVMDRNEPYVAYNKTELILNNILKHYNLEINSYSINYFTLDYQDMVNGCWSDFVISTQAEYNCLIINGSDQSGYIITEDGDFIITEDNKYIIEE